MVEGPVEAHPDHLAILEVTLLGVLLDQMICALHDDELQIASENCSAIVISAACDDLKRRQRRGEGGNSRARPTLVVMFRAHLDFRC